mmetsp:Transcript_26398/g.75804  ORF Transcript_26398/g.75804 Transcript_26398/m.75804 type:complete len:296 (-) Transcript_26398:230-1117(-)
MLLSLAEIMRGDLYAGTSLCREARLPVQHPQFCPLAGLILHLVPFFSGLEPVEPAIVGEILAHEKVLEESAEVGVVWAVLEAQRLAVVEVRREDGGAALAELLNRGLLLALLYLCVLLLLRTSLGALPRQITLEEVDQEVAHGLQVVSPALLEANVRVHGHVPGGASEVLPFAERYMLLGLRVAKPLGQPKVNEEDGVCRVVRAGTTTNEEVLWLNVAVDVAVGMQVLDPVEDLVRHHQDGPDAELPSTSCKQIFERGPEQVHDHDVVALLHAAVAHGGDAVLPVQLLQEPGLVR